MSKDKLENTFGAHGFFTPKLEGLSSLGNWRECFLDGQESFKDWVSDYLELTTYEISCPAMRDPDLAPEGKMGIIVSTLMDYGLVRQISDKGEYEKFKEFVSNKIIQVINDTLLQGLIENIDFTICSTPLTMEKITGNYQGAITGWEFTDKMPSENRFNKIRQSIETPIKDIFQCGQWTFSPSGLPVSVLTGKLAADMVKKTMEE
jgi:phytoene dehydrogenase-like protein